MTAHTFQCSDTPGVFECPACAASAHYDRDERRYCVHPADESEPARLFADWADVPNTYHGQGSHVNRLAGLD